MSRHLPRRLPVGAVSSALRPRRLAVVLTATVLVGGALPAAALAEDGDGSTPAASDGSFGTDPVGGLPGPPIALPDGQWAMPTQNHDVVYASGPNVGERYTGEAPGTSVTLPEQSVTVPPPAATGQADPAGAQPYVQVAGGPTDPGTSATGTAAGSVGPGYVGGSATESVGENGRTSTTVKGEAGVGTPQTGVGVQVDPTKGPAQQDSSAVGVEGAAKVGGTGGTAGAEIDPATGVVTPKATFETPYSSSDLINGGTTPKPVPDTGSGAKVDAYGTVTQTGESAAQQGQRPEPQLPPSGDPTGTGLPGDTVPTD